MRTTQKDLIIPPRQCTCLRCGYVWFTRLVGYDPKVCPNCHDWYWNIQHELLLNRRARKRRSTK